MSASPFSRLFASSPPPAAVEISARRVTAVALAAQGASRTITGHASEPLAPGIVTPTLNAANVHNPAALAAAVKAAVDRLAPRPRRVALILPDSVAKVSLLRFDKLPGKAAELDQLIKWQMRKAAPFRVEDSQVSWTETSTVAGGGHEYLVVIARRDVIESYEKACDDAGVHAGLVDIASLNMVNAVLATQPGEIAGDWLLVHAEEDYTTLAVVRAGQIIFFRTRPADVNTMTDLGDLVHQTAMYHEDRLGGGAFTRVVVAASGAGGAEAAERTRRQIEERLGGTVEPLDVRSGVALRDRIVASPELLDALAPATGVLLRDRTVPGSRKPERVA
jgi:type IV pilus assembly protein PilM